MFDPAVADTATRDQGMNSNESSATKDGAAGHDEFRAAYGAWITTEEQLGQLGLEWQELLHASGGCAAGLSFDSICRRWRMESGAQLAIITVRNASGRLVGLAPFYVTCSLGDRARRLSFLAETGSHQVKILVDARFEDAVIQEIARMLADHRHEWDCIDLSLPGLMPLLDYVNSMTSRAEAPVPISQPN